MLVKKEIFRQDWHVCSHSYILVHASTMTRLRQGTCQNQLFWQILIPQFSAYHYSVHLSISCPWKNQQNLCETHSNGFK